MKKKFQFKPLAVYIMLVLYAVFSGAGDIIQTHSALMFNSETLG